MNFLTFSIVFTSSMVLVLTSARFAGQLLESLGGTVSVLLPQWCRHRIFYFCLFMAVRKFAETLNSFPTTSTNFGLASGYLSIFISVVKLGTKILLLNRSEAAVSCSGLQMTAPLTIDVAEMASAIDNLHVIMSIDDSPVDSGISHPPTPLWYCAMAIYYCLRTQDSRCCLCMMNETRRVLLECVYTLPCKCSVASSSFHNSRFVGQH